MYWSFTHPYVILDGHAILSFFSWKEITVFEDF